LWEQACKPGSVPGPLTLPSPPSRGARSMRSYQAATISLGRLLPGASSSLPGDAAGRLISPYVALHRAGFAQVSGHPEPRALLPHDCTLTLHPSIARCRGVCFCGTFLGVAPTGRYPAPCPLVSGLSSEDVWSSAVARPAPAPILALQLTRRNEASLDVVTSKAQPDPFLSGETLALRPEFSDSLDDFVAGRFEGLGACGAVPLYTKRRDPRDVEFVFLLDYRGELKGRLRKCLVDGVVRQRVGGSVLAARNLRHGVS